LDNSRREESKDMSAEPMESTLALDAPTFGEALEAATPLVFITPAIIGINLLVFAIAFLGGVSPISPTAPQVLPWGANYGPLTEHGQWWRLLTACFLHFGIIHLGLNMFALLQAGILAEKLFGNIRFVVLYLFAGLVGNVAGLYLHPMTVSAGASGAVFGVYGALLAYLLIQHGVVPSAVTISVSKFAGLFVVYNIVYGMAHAEVDMVAHIGGLVSGFVAGALLAQPLLPNQNRLHRGRTLAVTAGAIALIVGGIYFLPKQKANAEDWTAQLLAGPSVEVGTDGKVVYIDGATKSDAQHTADVLQKKGLFKKAGVAVVVSRDHDELILTIPFRDTVLSTPVWDNPLAVAGFAIMGVDVAPALGGPPMKIRFVSGTGQVKRELQIDSRQVTVGTKDKIWYSGAESEENAQQLGEALQKIGFLKDHGSLVQVSKGATGTDLSFVVNDVAWNDPRIVPGFQMITRKIAPSVGGLPITVHLLDRTLQPQKSFQIK
jgi:rhomboid protease GluP